LRERRLHVASISFDSRAGPPTRTEAWQANQVRPLMPLSGHADERAFPSSQ